MLIFIETIEIEQVSTPNIEPHNIRSVTGVKMPQNPENISIEAQATQTDDIK